MATPKQAALLKAAGRATDISVQQLPVTETRSMSAADDGVSYETRSMSVPKRKPGRPKKVRPDASLTDGPGDDDEDGDDEDEPLAAPEVTPEAKPE